MQDNMKQQIQLQYALNMHQRSKNNTHNNIEFLNAAVQKQRLIKN